MKLKGVSILGVARIGKGVFGDGCRNGLASSAPSGFTSLNAPIGGPQEKPMNDATGCSLRIERLDT